MAERPFGDIVHEAARLTDAELHARRAFEDFDAVDVGKLPGELTDAIAHPLRKVSSFSKPRMVNESPVLPLVSVAETPGT